MSTDNLRIGVFVCDCGSNIAGAVDTESVRAYAETLPNVTVAVGNKYTCADPGQQEIQRTIYEHNLNRVVVASCSPTSYEPIFRQCIEGIMDHEEFLILHRGHDLRFLVFGVLLVSSAFEL